MIEKISFSPQEQYPEKNNKEKIKELEGFLKKLSEQLRKEGLPVEDNCRISEKDYIFSEENFNNRKYFLSREQAEELYSLNKIKEDQEKILEREKEWFQEENQEIIKEKRKKKVGEQFEMLKTAILNKFLNDKFYIIRTNLSDDIFNKVDNVIIEKETGKTICAFDEIGDINSERFLEKKDKVLLKNKEGVKLKYGLKIQEGKIFLGEVKNLPIFYLAFDFRHFNKVLSEFPSDFKEKSDCEKRAFEFFTTLILKEASDLYKKRIEINPEVLENIEHFSRILKKYQSPKKKEN
ncbi:MAG: hypothetical protein ACPLXL_01935 [Minisyncoccia bacterium]